MGKVYQRKMKANVCNEEQAQVVDEYNNAFKGSYMMMGAQNQMDRAEEAEEEAEMQQQVSFGGAKKA